MYGTGSGSEFIRNPDPTMTIKEIRLRIRPISNMTQIGVYRDPDINPVAFFSILYVSVDYHPPLIQ